MDYHRAEEIDADAAYQTIFADIVDSNQQPGGDPAE
jgi:hypothetical protein